MIKKIIKYHKRHLKGTGPFKSLFLSVVFYAFAVTGEAIRRAFQVVCAQVKRGITTGGCWKDEVCQLQHNLELWRPHFVFAHNVTILSKFSIQFLFPFLFSLSHEKKNDKKMIKYYKRHLKGTGPFKSQDPLPLCRFLRVCRDWRSYPKGIPSCLPPSETWHHYRRLLERRSLSIL